MKANSDITIKDIESKDIKTVANILRNANLYNETDLEQRIEYLHKNNNSICLLAYISDKPAGVLLASFNGFHIFLSHIATSSKAKEQGIGTALHNALIAKGRELSAKSIIVDSWLTSAPFFYKLGYRTPGAIFLIKDI